MVYLAIVLAMLAGTAHRGAKMLVSLQALHLGATPLSVGVLAAMFAAFPLLLAVFAGRVSDRLGVRRPIQLGALTMAGGLAFAFASPGLHSLYACAAFIGLGHIFFHVSIHNLIGSHGAGEARTRNFANFALGASTAAFVGPSLAGFSIDAWGYRPTFALLAAIVATPSVIVASWPRVIPPHVHPGKAERAGSLELLRDAGFRRTLVMSGVTLTGIELFTFYFPVYGRSIGLSASLIGVVMSSYAVAAFLVRLGMPAAVRRLTESGVLTASLFVAGFVYCLVPFTLDAKLLAAVAFLLGIGLGCAQPLTIILTYNHAPAGRSGEALGLRLAVNKITQIAVPLAFGGLGTAFGVAPVFWASGAFLVAGGTLSLRGMRAARASAAAMSAAAIADEEER